MPKRKRDEAHNTSSISPEPSSQRARNGRKKLCAQRIAIAQKPLVAALRLAAGFERQKFSRRKKTSKQQNDIKGAARLNDEYAKLKALDLNKLAEQHLRKVIAKVKSLRESDALPESARVIEKGGHDSALLNVQARLYKVDAVRKVVDEVIDDLKEIVGATGSSIVGSKDKAEKQKKTKRDDEAVDEIRDEDSDQSIDMYAAFDARIAAPSSAEDDSEDSLSGQLRPPSVEDSEIEGDYDLDGESESDSEEAVDSYMSRTSPARNNGASKISAFAGSDDDSGSDSDEVSIPVPKTKRKIREEERIAKSTFVPSLSHGAYYSGTESEASDLDIAPRRNRRGQRARQKIWEQKYGEKAQHVKKQEQSRGWDAKRGAVSDKRGGRGPERTGENAMPLGPKKVKRDDEGSLHPSWLAAKARKEKKVDMKPQGTKVVFD
jgi:hypothetical protein